MKQRNELWVDTKIVYEPSRKLARAYNRAMENTNAEWVLFLDQDLFLANFLNWYDMCLDAIRRVGHDAGWITAKTNRINPPCQKVEVDPDDDDILHHIQVAKEVYKQYGDQITECPKSNFSGFFILTNKTVWKAVGGFEDQGKGLSAIDWNYSKKIRKAGYKQYVIEGLYFYHLYKLKKKGLSKGF